MHKIKAMVFKDSTEPIVYKIVIDNYQIEKVKEFCLLKENWI